MNWVIYFFGSGTAFFSGVVLVISSVVILSVSQRKWSTHTAFLLACIGLIFIALSATPFPYWFYAGSGVISFIWLFAERFGNSQLQKRRKWLRIAVVLVWLMGMAAEIPNSFVPALNHGNYSRLYIFADSVTAGMGEAAMVTWPASLARAHFIEVEDFSQMGAKVSSMVRKAEKLSLGDGVILLEIGGNDLLGSTSAMDYERDLDKLLGMLTGPGRALVMFELPLPPFYNEFGRVQRRLAEKYRVKMIPKWVFIRVLTTGGATVDSVHLSRQGHELMAKVVWAIIQPAFKNGKT